MKRIVYMGLCLGLIGLAGAASAALLVGHNGRTLYTFAKDTPGNSACSWQCIRIWVPAKPGDLTGPEFGAITREGGARQLTYEGKPLYYYIGDHRPGDANGAGMDRLWHVVEMGASYHASN
jgi:predicted lipoprotein with Yx(FWY)xxD motif